MIRFAIAAAIASSLIAGAVHAKVITFTSGPNQTFSDGTFTTTNPPGGRPGGIFGDVNGLANTALNANGVNNLFIKFTDLVKFDRLTLRKCGYCTDSHPISFSATLYGADDGVLAEQTIGASFTATTLVFNTGDVRSVGLSFVRGPGPTLPGFGGHYAAWYLVSDVTYGSNVPEPANWVLMISGFGLIGGALRTRRRTAAA